MEHIFLQSDLAKPLWKFLALIFDKSVPRNMVQLQQDWFVKLARKDYLSCVALCMAACGLWEIWLSRNNRIHGNSCADVKSRLCSWAKTLGSKINAEYTPSFLNQLMLDNLHVPMPSNKIKGVWAKWCPSSSGYTLSITVYKFHCGGILRDASGTFKFGFKVSLECDDFIEGLISAMLLVKEDDWQVSCIQSSNQNTHLAATETYTGNWDRYRRWREMQKLLHNVKVMPVPVELNDTSTALCFQATEDGVYYNLRDLPKAVRVAMTSDYIQLPIWCRLKRKASSADDEWPRALRPGHFYRQFSPVIFGVFSGIPPVRVGRGTGLCSAILGTTSPRKPGVRCRGLFESINKVAGTAPA
ncbi:hypothetical protein QQ045_008645 [Rhodiola kirilowii]